MSYRKKRSPSKAERVGQQAFLPEVRSCTNRLEPFQ